MEIILDLIDTFMKLVFWIGSISFITKIIIIIIKLMNETYEEKEKQYSTFLITIIYYTSIYYMFKYIFI